MKPTHPRRKRPRRKRQNSECSRPGNWFNRKQSTCWRQQRVDCAQRSGEVGETDEFGDRKHEFPLLITRRRPVVDSGGNDTPRSWIGEIEHPTSGIRQRVAVTFKEFCGNGSRKPTLALHDHCFATRHAQHASGGTDRGRPAVHSAAKPTQR